jgi:hypothetical protein
MYKKREKSKRVVSEDYVRTPKSEAGIEAFSPVFGRVKKVCVDRWKPVISVA